MGVQIIRDVEFAWPRKMPVDGALYSRQARATKTKELVVKVLSFCAILIGLRNFLDPPELDFGHLNANRETA